MQWTEILKRKAEIGGVAVEVAAKTKEVEDRWWRLEECGVDIPDPPDIPDRPCSDLCNEIQCLTEGFDFTQCFVLQYNFEQLPYFWPRV